MYGVGSAPTPLVAATKLSERCPRLHAPSSTPSPDPVHGTTASTSPISGVALELPGHRRAERELRRDAALRRPGHRPGRPVLHERRPGAGAELPAAAALRLAAGCARSGLVAHGVVIDSLTSQDNIAVRARQRPPDAQHERRRAAADVHRRVVAGEDPEPRLARPEPEPEPDHGPVLHRRGAAPRRPASSGCGPRSTGG